MNIAETFKIEDEVRDNEIDLQGVVNNANYLIYMAHARHKHLKVLGIDFAETHRRGHNLVVVEANIKYKEPLGPGDRYIVTSKIVPVSKVRVNFEQEVVRKQDNKVSTIGTFTATSISTATGKLEFPEDIKTIFGI